MIKDTPSLHMLQDRIVVVDTSSLLIAGTGLLSNLECCELVIPAVVVSELEEKRNHPTLGYLARQWINLLEDLRISHGVKLAQGAPLPDSTVTLRVEPNHRNQKSLPEHLQNNSADSTVLAVAVNLDHDADVLPQVALLSNDIPMRLHATLDLEIDAFEFSSSLLDDEEPYDGIAVIRLTNDEYASCCAHWSSFNNLPHSVRVQLENRTGAHTLVKIFVEAGENPANIFRLDGAGLHEIERKINAHHIVGRTMEQDLALYYLRTPAHSLPVVSLVGSAGTGKTLLTLAAGLEAVKNREYQKIVVFRSLHEMGQGQEMGFLPGGVAEKMGPWAGAVQDALDVIALTRKPEKKNEGPAAVEDRKKIAEKLAEMIEVSPITYLRGRSLAKSFIVLDEAQNFSRTELLNIISRVGEDSKLVILGDTNQVDNRFLKSGRHADIWSVIRSFRREDLFAHVTLTKTERSKLAELASAMLEGAQ